MTAPLQTRALEALTALKHVVFEAVDGGAKTAREVKKALGEDEFKTAKGYLVWDLLDKLVEDGVLEKAKNGRNVTYHVPAPTVTGHRWDPAALRVVAVATKAGAFKHRVGAWVYGLAAPAHAGNEFAYGAALALGGAVVTKRALDLYNEAHGVVLGVPPDPYAALTDDAASEASEAESDAAEAEAEATE